MSEPIETVVTDMRKFMGVYGQNHYSASSSAFRGTIDRKINRQLFNSPISGKKRNFSEADSQDNFNCLAFRTPSRMSNYIDMENDEEDESPIAPEELIYFREKLSVAMNIDPDLRSKNLVYGSAKA